MRHFRLFLLVLSCLALPALSLCAAGTGANAPAAAAAATDAAPKVQPSAGGTTEIIEHLVDEILVRFDVTSDENTPTRYAISIGILLVTFLLRRVVTQIVFSLLGRLASKTETTLDDKLFTALRSPCAALVVVIGGVGALKALKLTDSVDHTLGYTYSIAFSLVIFWILFAAFNTVLDHMHEVATQRQMGVAAFMPWIKKTLIVVFVVIGALLTAQSLGADVKAFLAGLGIGGLAFALAAQDTIANVFGSVVVAIDQPFKIGETVQIGQHIGTVEDIGLRSTKIRTVARSQLTIPNKTVAAEAVTNLSRFTARRVEQTLGLTYATTADQMADVVDCIRGIITKDEGVDPASVIVQFSNFGASSLDIFVVYVIRNPDFAEHLRIKQRLNLAIMRAIETRDLTFAYPTQTVHLDGAIAKQLATRPAGA
ncbi:mechanosensitive ion channel family protein [Nibricoccus sp. IMCC34717]|uniref:mechanosensitive ion channel family protein n=1 Tax=Nibricoccus sp. IMCC34717 TaxID=3034021 RepID=UPI00384E65CE